MDNIAIGIGAAIGVWVISRVVKGIATDLDEKRSARMALQSWHEDFAPGETDIRSDIEIHFPSMLMCHNFWSVIGYGLPGGETFRLSYVRRKADGTWEARMTEESHQMARELVKHRVLGAPGHPEKETLVAEYLQEFDSKGNDWKAMEFGSLETAYQRYIHAQDVITNNTEQVWKERERRHVEKETRLIEREESRYADELRKRLDDLRRRGEDLSKARAD